MVRYPYNIHGRRKRNSNTGKKFLFYVCQSDVKDYTELEFQCILELKKFK